LSMYFVQFILSPQNPKTPSLELIFKTNKYK